MSLGIPRSTNTESQLRTTLSVPIFISPNTLLDEEGNLVTSPGENVPRSEMEGTAPPGYGQHVLDRLYGNVVFGGFQTPEALRQPPAAEANLDAMVALISRLMPMT